MEILQSPAGVDVINPLAAQSAERVALTLSYVVPSSKEARRA